VVGTGLDALNLTLGNIGEAMQGKDTHFGAESVRFLKGNLPLLNLWYTRAALDHLLMNDLQEQLSPGYLSNMRERAQRDWGQQYWWDPNSTAGNGSFLPDRAPDLTAVAGQ